MKFIKFAKISKVIDASVIISTYNSEEWLEKVILGYSVQTTKNFELVIADDGSRNETKELIDRYKKTLDFPLIHVWQEDNGFQKSQILNKAIIASSSTYLIFSDGDCIPRNDFVEIHLKLRKKNHFLSGGYFMLPMDTSKLINEEHIISQKCFDKKWLLEHGVKSSFKNLKISAKGIIAKTLNSVTTTKPSWNGHNASGWKEDLVKINGFNQEMQYGGQDRELGERLENSGIKGVQIRYSAICIHLDHARGYVNPETWAKNNAIRKNTRDNKVIRTTIGIDSN